jgi:hypothetical protein
MSIDDELETVGRITTLIKGYRFQTNDEQDVFTNESVDAYLKQQLSVAHYLFWQHLKADGCFARSPIVDSTLDGLVSLAQFKQLLKRYQRAVYELP